MLSATMIAFARTVPIEHIIDERGIKLRGKFERVGPCPICGGTDRFSVNVKKAVFNCRGCNVGGDVIALVKLLDSCNFYEACATLTGERLSSGTDKHFPERERIACEQEAKADERRRLQLVAQIWNEAAMIIGTPGEDYLMKRGISLDDVPESGGLRWHPECPWGSGGKPCIVSRFSDAVTGEQRGIHRRPISGEKPKSLGPVAGCVIRLWPDEDVSDGLVLGEGLETVLAASRIIHRATLLRPAWAAGGTGNLENFPILPGVEALTLLVDHDANGAGQRAAARCARRWLDAGREVIRLMPGELGLDFNNLVMP